MRTIGTALQRLKNDDENTEWTNDESKNSAATILERYLENNMRLNHNHIIILSSYIIIFWTSKLRKLNQQSSKINSICWVVQQLYNQPTSK